MANSDKNILITPNVGQTAEPTIRFTGANNTPITMRVLDPGTLSFEGTAGQLFSVADGLTGSIFSVNDISGIPSVEVMDTGLVKLAQYNGVVTVGTGTALRTPSGTVDAELSVLASTATTPGLIIRGATSQSANLQEWQNNAGTIQASINQDGVGTFNILRVPSSAGGSVRASIFTNSSSVIGLVVRGAASQTANLQEWQNSAGNIIASVDASGGFVTNVAYDFNTVSPPATISASLIAVAGNVNIGLHYYYCTFVTANGETQLNTTPASVTTVAGSQQVLVTIPVSTDPRVTARRIYRSIATTPGGEWQNYLLATINDNTTTTYTDNIADSSINTQGLAYARDNTTVKFFRTGATQSAHVGVTNTFFGSGAGATVLSGSSLVGYNTGIGINVLKALTTGFQNTAIGTFAAGNITTGTDNVAIGYQAYGGTTGTANVAIGRNAMFTGSSYSYNVVIGHSAANSLTTGSYNLILGYTSGQALTTQSRNIFIGPFAGKYAVSSSELIIDAYDRTNTANERTGAILYGVTNSTASSQTLTINAATTISYGLTVANTTDIKGLIVRGSVGQSVNLQEWQDSSGTTALAKVDSGGRVVAEALSTGRADAIAISWLYVTARSGLPNTVLQVNRGLTNHTGDLLQYQTSAGTIIAGVNAVGQTFTGSTAPGNISVATNVSATSSGTTATININSHGFIAGDIVVLSNFTPTGYNGTYLVATSSTNSFTVTTSGSDLGAGSGGTVFSTSQATIVARSAPTTALVVRGATSQTARLQIWQDSLQNPVASVDVFGVIRADSLRNSASSSNCTIRPETTGAIITTGVQANVALTIQNTNASPTGDLQRWLDKDGNILSRITSTGVGIFPTIYTQYIVSNADALTVIMTEANRNIALFTGSGGSYGGGKGVLFVTNANTAPTTNPTGGGVLYAESGALKWRGSGGGVNTIAPASAGGAVLENATIDGGTA